MSAPGEPLTAAAAPPDVAALQAQLARMSEQLEEIAAESRRSRERWEAIDELARDLTPLVQQTMTGVAERLRVLDERGYREVLGASGEVADRMIRAFDREGVETVGDNLLLLLKTFRDM